VARQLTALADGSGGRAALDDIRGAAGAVRGRGACAHPDGTAWFAISALEAFGGDLAAHVLYGGCGQPVRGVLLIPAAASGGSHLAVDWTRCDARRLCSHIVPELVSLDVNGYPAIPDRPVPAWLDTQARKGCGHVPGAGPAADPRWPCG
jgi:ferredoxin